MGSTLIQCVAPIFGVVTTRLHLTFNDWRAQKMDFWYFPRFSCLICATKTPLFGHFVKFCGVFGAAQNHAINSAANGGAKLKFWFYVTFCVTLFAWSCAAKKTPQNLTKCPKNTLLSACISAQKWKTDKNPFTMSLGCDSSVSVFYTVSAMEKMGSVSVWRCGRGTDFALWPFPFTGPNLAYFYGSSLNYLDQDSRPSHRLGRLREHFLCIYFVPNLILQLYECVLGVFHQKNHCTFVPKNVQKYYLIFIILVSQKSTKEKKESHIEREFLDSQCHCRSVANTLKDFERLQTMV